LRIPPPHLNGRKLGMKTHIFHLIFGEKCEKGRSLTQEVAVARSEILSQK
jgi:hypothetical protein